MFNEAYVKAFKEEQYMKALKQPNYLATIAQNYLNRYQKDTDVSKLAIKDSLDHYIAKKISEDRNFLSSQEFENYANYLKGICKEKVYKLPKNNNIYLEFSTNVVFEYLSKDDLDKIYSHNSIAKTKQNNEHIISEIISKIENKQSISILELELISDYFDNKKSGPREEYSKYIKYIFENSKNIIGTPKIISAILTYLPGYYSEGVESSRAYLGTTDFGKKINIAHSSWSIPYISLDYEYFINTDFKKHDSVNSSRQIVKKDINQLLFIAFHELAHQKQKNNAKEASTFDAVAYEINNILSQFDDEYYAINHDTDEIEIDADEKGWIKCASFSDRFIDKSLYSKCMKNSRDVHCRRAFSIKIDRDGNKRRYMDFDVEKTMNIIKNTPGILSKYTNLAKIFDDKGRINIDFLFHEEIAATNAGREFCNYILNKVPLELIEAKINSGIFTKGQICRLLNNFVEVPHYNALALRNMKKTDFKTYSQTRSNINTTDSKNLINSIYNYYFAECSQQLKKFDSLLALVTNKRLFNKEVIGSYRKFFEDYYFEMLENIDNPNWKYMNKVLKSLENSNSEYIKGIGIQTRQYLQGRFSINGMDANFNQNIPNSSNIKIGNIRNVIAQSKITKTDVQKCGFVTDIKVKLLKDKEKQGYVLNPTEQKFIDNHLRQGEIKEQKNTEGKIFVL